MSQPPTNLCALLAQLADPERFVLHSTPQAVINLLHDVKRVLKEVMASRSATVGPSAARGPLGRCATETAPAPDAEYNHKPPRGAESEVE